MTMTLAILVMTRTVLHDQRDVWMDRRIHPGEKKKKAEKEINGWVRKDKDPEKKRREREGESTRYGK